jgi:peptidoglycan/LPS O-acetylase OafA/YrhL
MLLAFGLRERAGRGAARTDMRLGPAAAVLFGVLVWNLWMPFPFQAPFVYAAAAGLICCAVCQSAGPFARLLSVAPLVWIGRISYSLYLWHLLIIWAFGYHDRGLAIAVAFLAAWVSYRYIEKPFRRRNSLFRNVPAPRLESPAVVADMIT